MTAFLLGSTTYLLHRLRDKLDFKRKQFRLLSVPVDCFVFQRGKTVRLYCIFFFFQIVLYFFFNIILQILTSLGNKFMEKSIAVLLSLFLLSSCSTAYMLHHQCHYYMPCIHAHLDGGAK